MKSGPAKKINSLLLHLHWHKKIRFFAHILTHKSQFLNAHKSHFFASDLSHFQMWISIGYVSNIWTSDLRLNTHTL